MSFIQGEDCNQITLFIEAVDDQVFQKIARFVFSRVLSVNMQEPGLQRKEPDVSACR